MLQLGYRRIGPDLYEVAHVDGTPEPRYGIKLVEGPRALRIDQLPPTVRDQVGTAVAYRAAGRDLSAAEPAAIAAHLAKRADRGTPSRIQEMELERAEVGAGDLVTEDRPPPRWAGER